jgi:membrane dipeptidase
MAALFRLEHQSDNQFRVVRTSAEIERSFIEGWFAAVLHLEGAEAIDPDFSALEVFRAAGLRSIGPVWSRPNMFGHGVPITYPGSPDCGPGLTPLGKELIHACNRLRLVIDLSHMTERGFWDVAELTEAPLVATHSNAYALTATPRNLTDAQLDAIRDSGGIVGVNLAVDFLRADGLRDPATSLDIVLRHFAYLVDRMGINHVGFGSDFDGATIPTEIGDASGLPKLVDALRKHRFQDQELSKLTHKNWVRVLRRTWGE